jgi:aspartyl-tRNA(Asn)/glutamyl-tRNA(Gln) amidotransferase subunit B
MEYEAQRQYDKFLADGKKLGQESKETRGWDETRAATFSQRRKEEVADYRYFPEPDLVPVVVDAAWLERARSELGELPAQQRGRLQRQYELSAYDAGVLTRQGRAFVAYFEEVARLAGDAKAASNWLTNQVLATLNEQKQEIGQFRLSAAHLAELIREVRESGLNASRAREVYARMVETSCTVKEAMEQLGIKAVSDAAALREIVARAVAANPKAVADFKKGKTKAADAIKGAVMRETRGMAKMDLVQQLVAEALEKA